MQAVTNGSESGQELLTEGELTCPVLSEPTDFLRSLSALATCD
jgi:hypothetical protein